MFSTVCRNLHVECVNSSCSNTVGAFTEVSSDILCIFDSSSFNYYLFMGGVGAASVTSHHCSTLYLCSFFTVGEKSLCWRALLFLSNHCDTCLLLLRKNFNKTYNGIHKSCCYCEFLHPLLVLLHREVSW